MTVAVIVSFEGGTSDMYDQAMVGMGFDQPDADWPEGVISHLAGSSGDTWYVIDVWGSRAQFDDFVATRLAPVIGPLGFGAPTITEIAVYNSHTT